MKKGKVIAFEGFDGVGKTTLSSWTADKFHFLYHKSPSGTFLDTRASFDKDGIPAYERFAFYCGDCVRVSNFIEQIILSGQNIVLDRYYISTLAYHKALHPELYYKNKEIFKSLNHPDLFILLQVDFDEIQKRIASRELLQNDRNFITEDFYKTITSNFTEIISQQESRYLIIDNNKGITITQDKIMEAINQL